MGNYVLPCVPLGGAVGQVRSKVPQKRPLSGKLQGMLPTCQRMGSVCREMLLGSVLMGKMGTAAMICTHCLLAILHGQGWASPGKNLIYCCNSSHLGFSDCPCPHFPSLLTTMQHVVSVARAAQKWSISRDASPGMSTLMLCGAVVVGCGVTSALAPSTLPHCPPSSFKTIFLLSLLVQWPLLTVLCILSTQSTEVNPGNLCSSRDCLMASLLPARTWMSPMSTRPLLWGVRFILFFMYLAVGTLGLETGFLQLLSGRFGAHCRGRGLHPSPSSTAPSSWCVSVYLGLAQGLEGNSCST